MFNLYKDGKLVAKVQGKDSYLAAGTLIAACFADVVKCNGWVVLSAKEARTAEQTTPEYYASAIGFNLTQKQNAHTARTIGGQPFTSR